MSWNRFAASIVGLVIVVVGWTSFAAGQDSAVQLAERLLDPGWDRSPQTRGEAQSWYENAPAAARSNPWVEWSYALNRIQHRRYKDAKPLVDRVAQVRTNDWDVRYAQIWLSVFVKEFDQGLALIGKLKADMDAATEIAPDVRNEVYFRMGRLMGYMQGPYGDRVDLQRLAKTETAFLEGVEPQAVQSYTDQRDLVVQQFANLMAARDQKQASEMENLIRKQQVELEQQSALVGQMQQQSADARASRETVVNEGQANVDAARQQLDAATAEWNRIQSLISSAAFELEGIWFSIAQIDEALRHETDPAIRHRLLLDRNYYLMLARDREFGLSNLRANRRAVDQQIATSAMNVDQTTAAAQNRVNAIDQQIIAAESTMAKANRKIQSLQDEPRVSSSVVGTIDATASALTNYDPFPADMLKQRALEAMRAKAN
jgi:hypothetical protein